MCIRDRVGTTAFEMMPKMTVYDRWKEVSDYQLKPVETWLENILNAEFVVTDSFQGAVSVSYTHLDVYKRQTLMCPLAGTAVSVNWPSRLVSIPLEASSTSITVAPMTGSLCVASVTTPFTVSYTHLDVYKRQH